MKKQGLRICVKAFLALYAVVGQLIDCFLFGGLMCPDHIHVGGNFLVVEFLVALSSFCGVSYAMWRCDLLKEGFAVFLYFYNCLVMAVNIVLVALSLILRLYFD